MSGGATAAAVVQGALSQFEIGLKAVEKAVQFVHHQLEKVPVGGPGNAGDMGRKEYIVQPGYFVAVGDRVGVENIEASDNIAALEAFDQGDRIDDGTAGDVDQYSPRGDQIQFCPTDHALGPGGLRGQTDNRIGARQDLFE